MIKRQEQSSLSWMLDTYPEVFDKAIDFIASLPNHLGIVKKNGNPTVSLQPKSDLERASTRTEMIERIRQRLEEKEQEERRKTRRRLGWSM